VKRTKSQIAQPIHKNAAVASTLEQKDDDRPNDTLHAFVLIVTRAAAQSHKTNMMSDQTMSTATADMKESVDAKRMMIKITSKKMVKPPTQAAYGNVDVDLIIPWSRMIDSMSAERPRTMAPQAIKAMAKASRVRCVDFIWGTFQFRKQKIVMS